MSWQKKLLEDKYTFRDSVGSICVIGSAKSGIAAAKLAKSLGKKVYLSDCGNIEKSLLLELNSLGITIESGGHSKDFIAQAECVVISPGVPTKKFKDAYLSRDQVFVGELEFASWYLATEDIIAITGTNGKTTTTTVAAQLLEKYLERPVYCLGNIGTPLSELVLAIEENAVLCLELSSFQLETTVSFKAHVAVLLNVTPDHYDRYESFDSYYEAKRNIFMNLSTSDHIVTSTALKDSCIESKASVELLDTPDNLDFIKIIVGFYGISEQMVEEYWKDFKGLEHRRELIDEIDGVRYVNDSKATNVEATIWALKSETGEIILLAGGKDKGFDFSTVAAYLSNVKKIFAYGDTAKKINEQLSGFVPVELVRDLETAVLKASDEAQKGDTILLSPMCSSFDQFENYMQRGHVFRKQVHKLRG